MAHIYAWKAENLSPADATEKMQTVLAEESQFFERCFLRPFPHRSARPHGVFVGQVGYENGVLGWSDWMEAGATGACWAGVCEEYLGTRAGEEEITRLVKLMSAGGRPFAAMTGRFTVVAWDTRGADVFLCTGAHESPSVWAASGPHGWAVGTRPHAVIKLCGRTPALNDEALFEFAACGYLVGDHGFLEGLTRIPLRTRVRIRPDAPPVLERYAHLGDLLHPVSATGLTEEIIAEATEAVSSRIALQLKHSDRPQALLSGGKDSRCVVAAMVDRGYPRVRLDLGSAGFRRRRLCTWAARLLELPWEHMHAGARRSPMEAILEHPERLLEWSIATGGHVSAHNTAHLVNFFTRTGPVPAEVRQLYHGQNPIEPWFRHAPHMSPPTHAERVRSFFSTLVPASLRLRTLREPIIDRLAATCDPEFLELSTDFSQWLQLFYWNNRSQHHFGDVVTAEDPWYWRWTPLIQPAFIQAGLSATMAEREQKQLTIAIGERLVPRLRGYAMTMRVEETSRRARLGRQMVKVVQGYHPRFPYRGKVLTDFIPTDHHLRKFWELVLFAPGEHHWERIFDAEHVRSLTGTAPLSPVLWKAATIELAARAASGAARPLERMTR